MNKINLWEEIKQIKENGFSPEGLHQLELYAELFNERKLLYQRFSPSEQHGCSTGGGTHVIATLLTGAEVATSGYVEGGFTDFKTELQFAKKQIETIKAWAQNKDRITLHNAYFPETRLKVIGFGESDGEFKIIVEQPYIRGFAVTDQEIKYFLQQLGFQLYNQKNWTYYTPDIYLSDMHDENIVKSKWGTFFVLDCDIRLNAPFLKTNGTRNLSTDIILTGQ